MRLVNYDEQMFSATILVKKSKTGKHQSVFVRHRFLGEILETLEQARILVDGTDARLFLFQTSTFRGKSRKAVKY